MGTLRNCDADHWKLSPHKQPVDKHNQAKSPPRGSSGPGGKLSQHFPQHATEMEAGWIADAIQQG